MGGAQRCQGGLFFLFPLKSDFLSMSKFQIKNTICPLDAQIFTSYTFNSKLGGGMAALATLSDPRDGIRQVRSNLLRM